MKLSVHAAPWSHEAAALLAPAMAHEPGVTVDTLAYLCSSGAGCVYEVTAGGDMVGAYVLRVEQKEGGREGVIVAAGGRLPGHSLVRSVLPVIEGAQFAGCEWVRVHTARRGLMRELQRQGYHVREVVLSKELGYGRQKQ